MNYDQQIDSSEYGDRHGQLSQINMLESDVHPRIDTVNDNSPYKNANQMMHAVATHSALRHRSLLSETCSDVTSVAFGATTKNPTGENTTSVKKVKI